MNRWMGKSVFKSRIKEAYYYYLLLYNFWFALNVWRTFTCFQILTCLCKLASLKAADLARNLWRLWKSWKKRHTYLQARWVSLTFNVWWIRTWLAVLCGLLVFWKFVTLFSQNVGRGSNNLLEWLNGLKTSQSHAKRMCNEIEFDSSCILDPLWRIPQPWGWNLEDLLGTEKMFRRWWVPNKFVRKSEKLDCTLGKTVNRSCFILFHPTFILLVHISSSLLKIDLLARGGKRQSAATECNSSKLWWHKLISHLTRHRWPQTGR